jgi:hypothetical protein
MATDYDASRKTEEEQKEESLEARRLTSGEQDKTSGKVDEDETELAESFELRGHAQADRRVHLHLLLPGSARVSTVLAGRRPLQRLRLTRPALDIRLARLTRPGAP